MVQYEVQVYTANTKDAGTKSSVFINIFGKNGESGRRRLLKSSRNKTPFQNGKVHVFFNFLAKFYIVRINGVTHF